MPVQDKLLPEPGTNDIIMQPHVTEQISGWERVRLGGDELAICASIGLAPGFAGSEPVARVLLLDVGFRKSESGHFGPYDIDGSGQKREFKTDYVLVRQDNSEATGPRTFYHEVEVDQEVHIGRQGTVGHNLGLDDGRYNEVSRDHCSLTVSRGGIVTLVDNGSVNGTVNEGLDRAFSYSDSGAAAFGYTISIEDYVSRAGRGHHYESKDKNKGWGHGVYANRPVIARDTPINGGVWPVGGRHGEALVIDDQKYPKDFNDKYDEILNRLGLGASSRRIPLNGIMRARGKYSDELEKLNTVFDVVSKTLRYDLESTRAIARDYQKVTLNSYMREGVGVCRTQAALGAYFIERLIKDGILRGNVSIDRNTSETLDGVSGGHAWTRFTDEQNRVYIIDPAQKFVGKLSDAQKQSDRWDYRRTEDILRDLLPVSTRR